MYGEIVAAYEIAVHFFAVYNISAHGRGKPLPYGFIPTFFATYCLFSQCIQFMV